MRQLLSPLWKKTPVSLDTRSRLCSPATNTPITALFCRARLLTMSSQQPTAILSVYDKAGLLDLAKGLHAKGVRLLGSGGTAKLVRQAGLPIG